MVIHIRVPEDMTKERVKQKVNGNGLNPLRDNIHVFDSGDPNFKKHLENHFFRKNKKFTKVLACLFPLFWLPTFLYALDILVFKAPASSVVASYLPLAAILGLAMNGET